MPATKPRPIFPEKEETSNTGNMPKYVKCNLDKAQREEMAKWANNLQSADLLDLMIDAINAGYVMSWKEGTSNGQVFYQASLTMPKKEKVQSNSNMCMVTRASSAERAVYSLFFKHTEVMDKDWSSATSTEDLEW